jgi:hypothetical protein
MSRVDQAAVIDALRQCLTPPEHVRDLAFRAGLSLARTKDAVQALRYQGKIKFETLALSASMLVVEEGPASGGLDAVAPARPETESAPSPAMQSQAKARVDVRLHEDGRAERVSRPAAGRSAAATSEPMDVTAGETAPAGRTDTTKAPPAPPFEPAREDDDPRASALPAEVVSPPGLGGLFPHAPRDPAVGALTPGQVGDFIAAIDVYLARTGMQGWELGRFVLDHAGFWPLLNKRRTARWETVAKILAFMARWPEGATRAQVLNARGDAAARKAVAVRKQSVAAASGTAPAVAELQREVALEAEARGASRGAARVLSATRKGGTSPLVETIQAALLEEPEDLFAFLRRRWPELLQRALVLGRVTDRMPGAVMAEIVEIGLSELEERALESGLLKVAA